MRPTKVISVRTSPSLINPRTYETPNILRLAFVFVGEALSSSIVTQPSSCKSSSTPYMCFIGTAFVCRNFSMIAPTVIREYYTLYQQRPFVFSSRPSSLLSSESALTYVSTNREDSSRPPFDSYSKSTHGIDSLIEFSIIPTF